MKRGRMPAALAVGKLRCEQVELTSALTGADSSSAIHGGAAPGSERRVGCQLYTVQEKIAARRYEKKAAWNMNELVVDRRMATYMKSWGYIQTFIHQLN